MLPPIAAIFLVLSASNTCPPVRPPGCSQESAGEAAAALPRERVFRRAWKKLDAQERREATQWFLLESRSLDTLQARTISAILVSESRDSGFFPEPALEPVFDPAVHTPGIRSKRKRVKPESRELKTARKKFLPRPDEDALRRAFRYRWSTGAIERLADPEDPEIVFENALHGFPPGLDLAQAIVLSKLDDGAERSGLAAFGHTYVNNKGKAFSGVTLYDAIQSGQRINFPDVDSLGLAHDLFDKWTRWKAPLNSAERKTLYAAITDEFQHVARYRGLREALAQALLHGEPQLAEGYDTLRIELAAFWIMAAADPARARTELPGRADWAAYFAGLRDSIAQDAELAADAREQVRRMDTERDATRRLLWDILRKVAE